MSAARDVRRHAIVVVDPQKAFVDPRGSLARAYGLDEIQPNLRALARLGALLARAHDAAIPVVLVRSEYQPGQFTEGRLDDPLSHVCVPGVNIDCEWADGIDAARAHRIVTKGDTDACGTVAYLDCLRDLVTRDVKVVYFAGFQLTTCVRATALSSARVLGATGIRSVVLKSACGARAASYLPQSDGGSRVERTCAELVAAGVEIAAAF